MTDAPARWVTRNTAAAYIDASPRTVDRLANDGVISRRKIGTLVRFDLEEIDALLKSSDATTDESRD